MDTTEAIAEIAAAWEVWSDALHTTRRHAQLSVWAGDLPDEAQRAALRAQHEAQQIEAYARARVQCAIGAAADGLVLLEQYDQHWIDTWGVAALTRVSAIYAERHRAALGRQRAARESATAQGAALQAAGFR